MLHDDRGFKSPWKAPSLPRAKKALLALLMLSVTEFLTERLEFHHTPRHFNVANMHSGNILSVGRKPAHVQTRCLRVRSNLVNSHMPAHTHTHTYTHTHTTHSIKKSGLLILHIIDMSMKLLSHLKLSHPLTPPSSPLDWC